MQVEKSFERGDRKGREAAKKVVWHKKKREAERRRKLRQYDTERDVHDPEQDDFVDGVQKVEGVFLTSTKTLEGTGEDPATEISNQHAQAEKKAQAIFPRHSDFEDPYFVARNASAHKARADGFAFLSL